VVQNLKIAVSSVFLEAFCLTLIGRKRTVRMKESNLVCSVDKRREI